MSKGYVYILSNEAMPGLVKVGKTTRDPVLRAQQLYQTGVPAPFVVAHSVHSPDCHDLERFVHSCMAGCRVNENREFFAISVKDAVRHLDNCHGEQLSLWLDEFAPDQVMVPSGCYVDPADLSILALDLDEDCETICSAFYVIEPDEYRPFVDRWKAKIAARAAK